MWLFIFGQFVHAYSTALQTCWMKDKTKTKDVDVSAGEHTLSFKQSGPIVLTT